MKHRIGIVLGVLASIQLLVLTFYALDSQLGRGLGRSPESDSKSEITPVQLTPIMVLLREGPESSPLFEYQTEFDIGCNI
jgi:hypothetical protein